MDGLAPYLLLAAPAGRGKSALLARWSRRLLVRDDLAVIFFPNQHTFPNQSVERGVPGADGSTGLDARRSGAGNPATPVEVWRSLMAEYFTRPLPHGRRLVVIIDGLDEGADLEAGPDLFPLVPPKSLRVVLSVRERAGDRIGSLATLDRVGSPRPCPFGDASSSDDGRCGTMCCGA